MNFEYEELPSGITAVFGSRRHFETSSVRLVFKAGSLHEDPGAPSGVAHFLEHTPFQGTREFASLDDLNTYTEKDGMDVNAYTGTVTTAYTADGSDLERTMNVVFQLGFHPLLAESGVESDRNAITEEAREAQYHAYRPETQEYERQVAGTRYARLVTGNVEDIARITQPDLVDYYRAHYQPGNAFLVVCSSLPVARQRKLANELASHIDEGRTIPAPGPTLLNLPWLTPEQPVSAFHNKLDDFEAQSGVVVAYNLNIPKTFADYVLMQAAEVFVNNSLFTRLREKLNLVYGASADLTTVENANHGATEDYFALEVRTTLAGTNVTKALDAVRYVEDNLASEGRLAQAALFRCIRRIKGIIEGPPAIVADNISESGQVYYDNRYSPREQLAMVTDLTVRQVIDAATEMISDRRLISLAGPDARRLATAVRHAEQLGTKAVAA